MGDGVIVRYDEKAREVVGLTLIGVGKRMEEYIARSQKLLRCHPVNEQTMIKEHDRVVLKSGVPEQELKAGDVGTVIHVYKAEKAFEVEFLTLHGETVAIATLEASQIRPVQKREITHARLLRA